MSGFDAHDYRFWFLRLESRLHTGWFGTACVITLTPYLLGLAFVVPFGYAGLYLRTPAFYFGLAGILLVAAVMSWGIRQFVAGVNALEPVVDAPEAFHQFVDCDLRDAAQARSNTGWTLAIFAGLVVLAVKALHHWDTKKVGPAGHHFRAFPVDWQASSALVPIGLALGVYAIAVSLTFGTCSSLLGRNLRFVVRLRTFPFMPFSGRVRVGVRRLARAYIWVSALWMAGVALVALFFFQDWTTFNVALLVVLAVMGALTFAIPYSALQHILNKAHEDMTTRLVRGLGPLPGPRSSSSELANFATVNTTIEADPPAVLTRRGAIAYLAVQVTTIGTILAREAIQENVSFLKREPSPKKEPAQPAKR